jgi:hypothetical protein
MGCTIIQNGFGISLNGKGAIMIYESRWMKLSHAPRWHLGDLRGFLDDLCFAFELLYVSSGLNSSQAHPSCGKSTTMKMHSSQAWHNPLQWKPSSVECLQASFHPYIGGRIHGCGTKMCMMKLYGSRDEQPCNMLNDIVFMGVFE